VTIYRPDRPGAQPPKLQVQRLDGAADATVSRPRPRLVEPLPVAPVTTPEIVAHIQRRGDVPAQLGEWLGAAGSRLTIEGFAIKPADLRAEDIEYQAVLGRGWLSPWVEGGEFCGSRGLGLPLLGLRVRLKGAAAERCVCEYSASFVDGSRSGPHADGAACETEDLAALEAFQLSIRPRQPGGATAGPAGTVVAAGAVAGPVRRAFGAARPAAKGKAGAAAATPARTTRKSKPAEAPKGRPAGTVAATGAASRLDRRAPGAARPTAMGKTGAVAPAPARTTNKGKPGTSKRPRR
jgi:Clostridial hydrophobic W